MDADRILIAVLTVVFVPIVAFLLYITCADLPVSVYADAECLRRGYPVSQVTIGLQTYCSTLDGSITVRVEKLRGGE